MNGTRTVRKNGEMDSSSRKGCVLALVFVALGGIRGCQSSTVASGDRNRALQLPFELNSVHLYMSREELRRLRPGAEWNESSGNSVEEITTGEPFVREVAYEVSLDKVTQISMWRYWQLAEARELSKLLPGLLAGCQDLWGAPDLVGVFDKPKYEDREHKQVLLVWKNNDSALMVEYTPRRAIEEAIAVSDRTPMGIVITLSTAALSSSYVKLAKLELDPAIVKRYYDGLPAHDTVDGPILK